jgi:hypothetical protein
MQHIFFSFLEHIFEKKIALLNSLTLSAHPSVRPSIRLSVRSSVPYIITIFQPIFKFWILREDYLSTRRVAGFFDPKPWSSGIELRLGPSQINGFFLIFHQFLTNNQCFSTDITSL